MFSLHFKSASNTTMSAQCALIIEKWSHEPRRDIQFSTQLWISQDEIHSDEQSKIVVRLVKRKAQRHAVWELLTPYTQLPLLFQNQSLCGKSVGVLVVFLCQEHPDCKYHLVFTVYSGLILALKKGSSYTEVACSGDQASGRSIKVP